MNNTQLWQAILGNLEVSISKGSFNTWFKQTSIIDRGPDYITLSVPNAFTKSWIVNKFQTQLLKTLKPLTPEIKEIRYHIGPISTAPVNTPAPEVIPNSVQAELKPEPGNIGQNSQYKAATPANHNAVNYREGLMQFSNGLNPNYIFDSFIIGANNELAHAASIAVSKHPGTQYNPLFIYGGVGLGKTHLMHAVGNNILENNQKTRVLYVTSEKFTNDYINAIRHHRIEEFKRIYRSVDVLLVDDIQFIASKEATQEEFFHTFNELRDKGKQIILTSDRLPKDIPAIEQRLVSRFEWGMIADIQAPNLETRLAILRGKIAKKGDILGDDILTYVAENVSSNIRELEGALNRVLMAQHVSPVRLGITEIEKILANMLSSKKKAVTMHKVSQTVADFYNVTMDDLIKQSRRKEFVKPRQTAMFLIRRELDLSFPIIGEFFGGRDHTTVMHGVDKLDRVLTTDEQWKQEVDVIRNKIYAQNQN